MCICIWPRCFTITSKAVRAAGTYCQMNELLTVTLNVTLSDVLMVLSVLLLSAGVVLEFSRSDNGVAFSCLGLGALNRCDMVTISDKVLLFWAVVTIIVLVIMRMRDGQSGYPALCRRFVAGGALAGMAVGMLWGYAALVAGAAVGAVLGAVAWSRTPSGSVYPRGAGGAIVEVGLPAVVVMAMTGIAINSFIAASRMGGV